METGNGRVDQLDVYQRELHYQKESQLTNGEIDFIFVMRHVLYDMAEYVDTLHAKIHEIQNKPPAQEAKIEVVTPVIQAFVNQGEKILVNGLSAPMEENKSYDVVVLPDMSTLQDDYHHVISSAIRVARKRVIVGYYAKSLKKRFEEYLNTLNYPWLKNEEVKEHYIIDLES